MANRQFRVLYDFSAATGEEASVKIGDLVTSLGVDEQGWTRVRTSKRGANGTNQVVEGLVPTSYIKLEQQPSAPTMSSSFRAPPAPPITVQPPRTVAEEHAECTICYGEMSERPAGVLIGSNGRRACRHFLHFECAQNLANNGNSKTCPICRSPFTVVKSVPDVDRDPRAWFECVDADGNGRLSKPEVLEVLKALLPVDYLELERNVDKLWNRWDTDHSGEVDFTELCGPGGLLSYVRNHFARRRRAPPPALTLSNREEFFTYWDEDGNGTLEMEEIVRAVVKTLRLDATKVALVREYLRNIWPAVDPDNSGEVDLSEFISRDGLGEMLIANLSFI